MMFKTDLIKSVSRSPFARFSIVFFVGVFLIVFSSQIAFAGTAANEFNQEIGKPANNQDDLAEDTVYLPWVAKNFPVIPSAPVLAEISNQDGDGNYTVEWSSSEGSNTFTLQEDDNPDFTSPADVYSGSTTSTTISGRDVGTYYYRVRGENSFANSEWSNIETAVVTVPLPECPQTVAWTGYTSQERPISFEVDDVPACRIAAGSLRISFKDSCGSVKTTVFLNGYSIANNHFETGIAAGTQVIGDFTSPTTASGTYSYESDSGTCTASGTWTAEYNLGANGTVYALAVQPDGKIVVGGSFTTLGGKRRSRIGRLNSDGSLDTDFNPEADGSVRALALQPDGKIVVGGYFEKMNGQNRSYIARLNADGTLDTNFNPGNSGSYWQVNALAVQPDGKIVVGGYFDMMGGQARDNIARLNPNGSLDLPFNPGAGDIVHTVALQPDGKILVGTSAYLNFDMVSPIHRLNQDGTLDTDFDAEVGGATNGTYVYKLLVQPDDKILVTGKFSRLNGVSRDSIGRLNSDGTLDADFNPGSSKYYYSIYTLGLQSDGKIVFGGDIIYLGEATIERIARLNTDGSIDTSFDPGANSTAYALDIQADDKVVAGGSFTGLNGEQRYYIGRLNAGGTLDVSFP